MIHMTTLGVINFQLVKVLIPSFGGLYLWFYNEGQWQITGERGLGG